MGKVNYRKRTREGEFDHCMARINGPVRKKIKAVCAETSQRIIEAVDSLGRAKKAEIYPEGNSGATEGTHPEKLGRNRREKVNQLVNRLVRPG